MKFTLVIPFFNRSAYLPRTLNSLLSSTLLPTAIILVDNGSTDNSLDICEQFQIEHPDLCINILHEKRPGVCYARNLALHLVETKWIYFFDSDDILSPDYFLEVSHFIDSHPDTDVVASPTCMILEDGTKKNRKVQFSDSPIDQILSGQLSTQSMFFRTSFLRDIGGWDTNLKKWNDWELGLRVLLQKPRIYWLHKYFHFIYQHSDSLTGVGFSATFKQILIAIQIVANQIQNQPKLKTALAFRSVFLAAHLTREKQPLQVVKILKFIKNDLSPTSFQTFFLHMIYRYILLGGRGSWYISKFFIKIL